MKEEIREEEERREREVTSPNECEVHSKSQRLGRKEKGRLGEES